MLYGLMADLHLHRWSAFAGTDANGLNTRFAGLLSEIRRCAHETHANGGKLIIIAGDVFHVRGSVAPTVLNATRDCLIECCETMGVRFFIIPGNHDLEGKESARLSSAVTALEYGDKVRVVDCSSQLSPGEVGLYDHGVVAIPWFENLDHLRAQIDAFIDTMGFDATKHDLILHAPIDGVIPGLPDHGLTPGELAAYGFKRVFAGHYHNHKEFDLGVYSIGALAHHSWSDVGSRAGFLLVGDTVDYRASHLPRFLDLGELAEQDPDELPLVVDGNFVRVKVEARKTKEVEAARQELLSMGAKAVLVQPQPAATVREGTTRATAVASGASLEISVAGFVTELWAKAPVEGVDVDAVKRAAYAVLAEAGV